MTGWVPKRKRSQGGIEMDKIGSVMLCPSEGVIVLDGEGVDPVKGLEVMQVR